MGANNFVRKLGYLTSKLGARNSNTVREARESNNPYRATRSMDLLQKPFMSSPMLAINFAQSTRHSLDTSSHSPGTPPDGVVSRKQSLSSSDIHSSTSIAQGLAVAAFVAEAGLRQRSSTSDDATAAPRVVDLTLDEVPRFSPSSMRLPHTRTDMLERPKFSSLNSCHSLLIAAGLEPPSPEQATGKETDQNTTANLQSVSTVILDATSIPEPNNKHGGDSNTRRPGAPRLSTLPPLKTIRLMETPEHRVRLSPSVIVRPPPFPILNLPSLPTLTSPGGQQQTPVRPVVRLNSMPLLPMEGQDEQQHEMEHDNYELEDEEGDDEELEESDHVPRAASPVSDEEEVSNEDFRGHTPLTSSTTLPRAFNTSGSADVVFPRNNYSSLLENVGLATGSTLPASSSYLGFNSATAEDSKDGASTPKARAGKDYFTFVNASTAPDAVIDEQKAKERELATPRASRAPSSSGQFTQTPPTLALSWAQAQTPGAGPSRVIKKINSSIYGPMDALSSSNARPGFYHHVSKSMVNLFSSAKSFDTNEARGSRATGNVGTKGKGVDQLQTEVDPVSHASVGDEADSDNNATIKGTKPDDGSNVHLATSIQATASSGTVNSPTLRRRASMPMFNTSGPPPPYPSFIPNHLRRFMPTPREDEGKESLPPYSNDIRLVAIMPRKMEFAGQGIPAKDRKWRRVQCVLEGTAFRVYRCPHTVAGVSALGGWWEKKVGVGDVSQTSSGSGGTSVSNQSTTNIVIGKKEPARRMKWEEEEADLNQQGGSVTIPAVSEPSPTSPTSSHPPQKSKRQLASAFLHPNRSRISLSSTRPSSPSPGASPHPTPRSSLQLPRSSMESSIVGSSATLNSTASSSTLENSGLHGHSSSTTSISTSGSGSILNFRRHGRMNSAPQNQFANGIPEPDPKDLIQEYTLQRAESGLASDYFKRKHVLRVRMEGQQFLLQATDVTCVVEWIEVRLI